MLADSKTLVTQCVPPALLEFSRSTLRERFSAIIRKPIYTFTFDRFKTVTPAMLRKLLKARDSRYVERERERETERETEKETEREREREREREKEREREREREIYREREREIERDRER